MMPRLGSGISFSGRSRRHSHYALVSLVRDLPNDKAADSIGRQLIRSGTSIGANIAEGYGRFSQGAYRNHLSIARGSAFETESWIDLLVQSNYVSREIGDELLAQCRSNSRS